VTFPPEFIAHAEFIVVRQPAALVTTTAYYADPVVRRAPEPLAPESSGDRPKDTMALRRDAKTWLLSRVGPGSERPIYRDKILEEMRQQYPGLGVNGAKGVWAAVPSEHPEFEMSTRGAKSKRITNNWHA
jgi:hypothetical protein